MVRDEIIVVNFLYLTSNKIDTRRNIYEKDDKLYRITLSESK